MATRSILPLPLTCQIVRSASFSSYISILLFFLVLAASLPAQMSSPGSGGGYAPPSGDQSQQSGGAGGGSSVYFDQPTAYSPMPPAPVQTEKASRFDTALQAICWYIPNRIMDITDILRFHISFGDGQGASLRATKYMTASWFEDNTSCLGWTKRMPPYFGEQVQERYFCFLAAKDGQITRPDHSEIGISAHFLIIGFNAAISLGELADAATGFVGIDLMNDDHGPVMFDTTRPDPEKEKEKIRLQKEVYGQSDQPTPAKGDEPNPKDPPPPSAQVTQDPVLPEK